VTLANQDVGAPIRASAQPLVRTSAACRYFQVGDSEVRAVDAITFEMPRGTLFALRGRSGSGKTTLLNLVGGLDRPTSGQVYFDDNDLRRMSDRQLTLLRRHRLGFVFQTFALLPVLSAFENIELTMRIAGVGARNRRDRTNEVLSMVGLEQRAHHRSFELSGGEQQRVAIARAIVNRPDLLIADEPTGELDSVTGLEIMMLFRSIVDDEGISILMATHDPALSQFADDTFLMEDGRMTHAEGPLDFDLPDLVQHIEFADDSSQDGVPSDEETDAEQLRSAENSSTSGSTSRPTRDEPPPSESPSESDDSIWKPRQ
jgi:ABC-type lipoprotein export system ATPase subunit